MPTLNGTQLTALQAELTNNDVAGFYSLLETYGDDYGRLGNAVTINNSWQGALANGFAASGAVDNNVVLTHGSPAWEDLNSNLAARYLTAYVDNAGATPTWDQLQTLHNAAYAVVGLDADDWLPNKLLNDSSDPAALWADYVDNTGAVDLWDDAFDVAGAGAGLVIPPAFAASLLLDPDFMAKMQFAKNFYNGLATLDDTTLGDMIGDFTGNGVVTDLLEFIASLPGAIGDLTSRLPDPYNLLPNGLPGWVTGVVDGFGGAELIGSPLVLDLDGDGIELAELNETGSVYWDIDEDGLGEASGWISGGDGLLAIDLNSDDIINDHGELFGNQTGGDNGFVTLDAYDSNNDNFITSADSQFADLLVWVDSNSDGYSHSAELHTLSSLNITSIATTYSNVSHTIAGNEIKQESTFTMNGNTRTIVDAWFAYEDVNS